MRINVADEFLHLNIDTVDDLKELQQSVDAL